ncbi:MAG: hypothetical protein H0T46_09975 [Deltaproteobacteria bacterium]|nr:hypothetical protein [Deltaproteobacteria bacterium]
MANPGYPQQPMGQMPPMGQPQPAVPQPKPKAEKRGTSKLVPVVVSAGLAVGTFCGLLFGVGLGEEATASPSSSETSKADEKKDDTTPAKAEPAKVASTEPAKTEPAKTEPAKTEPAKTEPAKTEPAKTEPAKTEPAKTEPAKTEPAKTAVPAVKKAKLTVELMPAAVPGTKITVDGKAIDGNSIDVDLGKDGKKSVKIVVKASGYKTVEQKVDLDGDIAVKIDLVKRPVSTTPAAPKPPKKKPPGGGGLIDI